MTANAIDTTAATTRAAFALDRLKTPIGTALLVTDRDGLLRALEWEDHARRMKELLRLHYGAVMLSDARAPREIRVALSGYFEGEFHRLETIGWRVAGTPFQRKVWSALPAIPPLWRAGGASQRAEGGACSRPRQRRQSDQHRHSLPSPDRRRRLAGQI